jgi:hypothetical protein
MSQKISQINYQCDKYMEWRCKSGTWNNLSYLVAYLTGGVALLITPPLYTSTVGVLQKPIRI